MRVTHIITRLVIGGAQENTLATIRGLRAKPGLDVKLISGPTTGPEGSLENTARAIFSLAPLRGEGLGEGCHSPANVESAPASVRGFRRLDTPAARDRKIRRGAGAGFRDRAGSSPNTARRRATRR